MSVSKPVSSWPSFLWNNYIMVFRSYIQLLAHHFHSAHLAGTSNLLTWAAAEWPALDQLTLQKLNGVHYTVEKRV